MTRAFFLKVNLFICFILFQTSIFAQSGRARKIDFERVKTTTSIVVLDDFPSKYNQNIMTAFNTYWHFNKFIFVKLKDVKQYFSDPQYSYISRTSTHSSSDTYCSQYRLVFGINNQKRNIMLDWMDNIAWIKLQAYPPESSDFCIVNLVQSLQTILTAPEMLPITKPERLAKNLEEIKSKTLYINVNYLTGDLISTVEAQNLYNYKFEIVTEDKIEEAILNQREDIVYFWVNVNQIGININDIDFKQLYVIAAKDGKFLFRDSYNIRTIRDKEGKIAKRDLIHLSEFLDREQK